VKSPSSPADYNSRMQAAFKRAGVPLWVSPNDAFYTLRHHHWSEQIARELSEWFARTWSLAFVAGFKNINPFAPKRSDVLRMLAKMNYAPHRASELADVLLDNLGGLYRKGYERRSMKF
jgi:hypothetical protein